MEDDEEFEKLETRIEKLEDLDLRNKLIEFCLKGKGDEIITKNDLLMAITSLL